MYFSNEVVTNEDLIKDYQMTIERYKKSIQRMINNPDENSDRRIKMAEASIKKYQEYIKQTK
jgi:hypothetical protein